jgi:3-hydroxybutyryl-CoA dehydratase
MRIPLNPGDSVTFRRTVAESDVYLFAGITGDFSRNHVDEAFMRTTPYGRRIAHGALLVGYMSRCSTEIVEKAATADDVFPVSLGYDKVRFLKPVFIGETIAISYEIVSIDAAKQRSAARVEVHNEAGELAAVATHIMIWLTRS